MAAIGWLLCFKYLQRRLMIFLCVAAVALSCALLIVTDSLFRGFIDAVEGSASRFLGDILLRAPGGRYITDYPLLLERLERQEAVAAAAATLNTPGLILSAPGRVQAVKAVGIELPSRLKVTPMASALLVQKDKPISDIAFGSQADGVAGGFVSIGILAKPDEKTDQYDLASVRAFVGKTAVLTVGRLEHDALNARRKGRQVGVRFQIADIVYSGVYEFDNEFVYLPLTTLSEALLPGQAAAADTIHIRIQKGVDIENALMAVRGVWQEFSADRFEWGWQATIISCRQMQARLLAEYHKQLQILLLIFGLVSAGIVLLVLCIFYLMVLTRRKDIAILKSCGVSHTGAAGIFLLFAVVAGVVGAAAGLGLGFLFIHYINPIESALSAAMGLKLWKSSSYLFSHIPNQIYLSSALWICASGVGAAVVGALIPSIWAARLRPVEILRYE